MKRKIAGRLLIMLLPLVLFGSPLPEPYASIATLPLDDESAFFLNQKPLFQILSQKKCDVIIEVGSWLGASARFMAKLQPENGKLYAVDTWNGSIEHIQERLPQLSYLFQQFLSNVIHTGLTDTIVPIRMRSVEAAKALNISADLIYLDAAHDTDSVCEDVLAWLPHLNPDGVFCGDDWHAPSVRKGVERALQKTGGKYTVEGGAGDNHGFWLLHPVSK